MLHIPCLMFQRQMGSILHPISEYRMRLRVIVTVGIWYTNSAVRIRSWVCQIFSWQTALLPRIDFVYLFIAATTRLLFSNHVLTMQS